jgi:AraC-like DNA-binding protein
MATALAFGIGAHAWRQRSFGLACLTGWVASAAAAAWAIALAGSGYVAFAWWPRVVGPANLLAGAMLLAYVYHALHQRKVHWLVFVPFAAHLAATFLLGDELNKWISVKNTIGMEIAFTLAAWVVYLHAARASTGRWPALPALGVLIAISTLHLGQLASMFGIGGKGPANLAPFIVIAVWLAIAIGIALIGSPVLRAFVPAVAPDADAADRELFARIEQVMHGQRPWTNPDLDVGALAAHLSTNANAVSRALSRAGNTNFYDYVNAFRVREAERLLLDPQEARIKIEALGRQAGFRARSTFFKAFRAYAGLSPAEFRRARNAAAAD